MARDAGTREVALAEVLAVNPVVLKVDSRRLGVGSRIVLLHRGDRAVVEQPEVKAEPQAGTIKLRQQHVGLLVDSPEASAVGGLEWRPKRPVRLTVGEQLIVANGSWFARADFTSGHEVSIFGRPRHRQRPKDHVHRHVVPRRPRRAPVVLSVARGCGGGLVRRVGGPA
ncbi:MAG: hypothetical protein IPJ15_15220 [Actinomycetales bacterium]|nr:hypothetical protein [Candidatus Phosphoribacter baldrii]